MTAPTMQRVRRKKDLARLAFWRGLAEIEVPLAAFDRLKIDNADRSPNPRLDCLMRSIRAHGYSNRDPIEAQLGPRGHLFIEDGGHRLTAIRLLRRNWLSRLLFGRRCPGSVVMLVRDSPSAAEWRAARARKRAEKKLRRAGLREGIRPAATE